jgi:DNA-directed RNA polymerase specialized sigma subunit
MTKHDLMNYQRIKRERVQIERLLRAAERQHLHGDEADKLIAYYVKKQNELATMQLRIENAIESLDPTERMILRLRYIESESWTKIGFAVHYSRSAAFEIHNRALEKLRDK